MVRTNPFTYSATSITLRCSQSSRASLQRRPCMPAGSPVVSSATTPRKGISSRHKTRLRSSGKSSLAFVVRRTGTSCTLRRCSPKEKASACGNARSATEPRRMGTCQAKHPLPARNSLPTGPPEGIVLARQQICSPPNAGSKQSELATKRPPWERKPPRTVRAAIPAS